MAERATLAAQGFRKTPPEGDGGPVLEKTIPMPEMGIGVTEHLAERREAESRSSKEDQEKQEAQRKADQQASEEVATRQSAGWTLYQKMAERARLAAASAAAIIEAQRLARERNSDDRGPRDRGLSM
jgi:predicted 2-oxoglutarate/Fe(II)-dependent dioxygenase YbiX